MKQIAAALVTGVAVLGSTQIASAADMWLKPAALPPVSYSWSGVYGGAHLGGAWGNTTALDLDGYNAIGDRWTTKPTGFVEGLQLGYNWQAGMFVFGAEGDLGFLGLHGRGSSQFPLTAGDTAVDTRADVYTTARGRLGLAFNRWLVFGTGGYIGVNTRASVLDTCTIRPCGPSSIEATDQSFRNGWTAGGGIEYGIAGPWSVKVEYLHFDLGDKVVTGNAGGLGPAFSWDTKTTGDLVRAGVNYRF